MRKFINKYRVSKYNRFLNGMIFALITVVALIMCLAGMTEQSQISADTILAFAIAIISILMGMFSMFRNPDRKYYY